MRRVFITGAEGFTGRYLSALLAQRGYEVHGFGRPAANSAEIAGVSHFHEGDLTDPGALVRALSYSKPQLVAHLAAVSFVQHGSAREIYESNLIGSRNLLQAIADIGLPTDAILLASSANVYGNQREGALDEGSVPNPVNDYAVSKLAMEMVAKLFAERLPIIVVRPFNYTGVGQSLNFLVPKIVDHVRRRARVIELGNLDVRRDFSDVRGVVDCYARLLESPVAVGQTFNICSGLASSITDILELASRLSGYSIDVVVNPDFVRPNEVHTLYGDNRRLRQAIGEIGMPPLAETLKWMIEA